MTPEQARAAAGGQALAIMRLRVLGVAVRPLVRSLRWRPLVGAAVAAAVVVWSLSPDNGDAAGLLGALRLGGFLLAAGGAFFLDDDAADTLACSPTTLWARRALRLGVLGAVFAVLWALLVGMASALAGAGAGGLPIAALTLEVAGMLALSVAVAAVGARWAPDGRGGVAGGPALTLAMLAAYLGQMRWPRYVTLFPPAPGDPSWTTAHLRWAALLAAAVTVVAITCADPARRRSLRQVWRRRPATPAKAA